jgi:HsdM N-terminal domain
MARSLAMLTTELDYTEQTSWILFLKYLDDLEQERALAAELVSKPYSFIIHKQHRWSKWAAHGNFDHDKALTGDEDPRRSDGLQGADRKSRRIAVFRVGRYSHHIA